MKYRFKAVVAACAILSAASYGTAQATVLTGNVTADNTFFAYLSNSAGTQGTLLGQGNDWTKTFSFSSAPLANGTYYLNIVAQNWTGEAGLVGSFSVGGTSFGTSTAWKTAYVPGAWSLNDPLGAPGQPNWTAPTGSAFNLGTTDVAYWGGFFPANYTAIDSNAQWIWGNDSLSFPNKTQQVYDGVPYYDGVCQTCTVEFQTKFTVGSTGGVPGAPELSTWGMMMIGFAGLGFAGYRRKQGETFAA
jgi:hypothetical protein